MNDATATDPFENIIRASGQGWLIDWYAPKEQALPNLRKILATANARGRTRLGGNAPTLTPESLVAEYERNPHKVGAFLQVIGSVATPDILVMVWRILQGMNITELRINYLTEHTFEMAVRLSSADAGGEDEVYQSQDIDDAVILRHLGVMKMNEMPIFDGFYPLNLGKKQNAQA
jgi:hypothetical protein